MNKETLEALQGSIRKWERIVAGTGIDLATNNCPLCHLFWDNSCTGCPVRDKTGKPQCLDTPYVDWFNEMGKQHANKLRRSDKRGIVLAQAELHFLKSLLPKIRKKRR